MSLKLLINEILQDGQPLMDNAAVKQVMDLLSRELVEDHKHNEEQLYKNLYPQTVLNILLEGLQACLAIVLQHENPEIKAKALHLANKISTLHSMVSEPEKYFEKLISDGSDLFHKINVPLNQALFVTELNVSISEKKIKETKAGFLEVKKKMDEATRLLNYTHITSKMTAGVLTYLQGRMIRRNKEVPVMEHLLEIRLKMNSLSQDNIETLHETVSKAVDNWRIIYLEMQDLREPLLKKKRVGLTPSEECSLTNYGLVAGRIDKAIDTLDRAFKKCDLISEEDYTSLTQTLSSARTRPHKKPKISDRRSGLFPAPHYETLYQKKFDEFKNEFKKYFKPAYKPRDDKFEFDEECMTNNFVRHGVKNDAAFLENFRSPIGICLISSADPIVKVFKDASHFSYYTKEEFKTLKIKAGKKIHPETNMPIHSYEVIEANEYRAQLLNAFNEHCKMEIYKKFEVEKELNPLLKQKKKEYIEGMLQKLTESLKKDLKWMQPVGLAYQV